MFEGLKRRIRYYSARSQQRFEAKADPQVQIEQAIAESQDQHRRLKEQAASVIAQQKQTELQLNRTMNELEKTHRATQQALTMADEATKSGDGDKAASYNATAEALAARLIDLEHSADDLKGLHLQAAQAADQAKAAVQQNAVRLQKQLTERQRLLGQLDQARMQEQINSAMSALGESVGQDVPSFEEVRAKIEARYAKAKGVAELSTDSVESQMLEIEQATMRSEARVRLDEMRQQMALGSGGSSAGELGEGEGGEAEGTGATAEPGAAARPDEA
jgi:phage shock protein A